MIVDISVKSATTSLVALLVIISMICTVPFYVLNAWVISKLWDWYLVRGFGLPPMGMIYAFGLSVLVGMLTFNNRHCEDTRGPYMKLLPLFCFPLFSLLMGWIGTFFI